MIKVLTIFLTAFFARPISEELQKILNLNKNYMDFLIVQKNQMMRTVSLILNQHVSVRLQHLEALLK